MKKSLQFYLTYLGVRLQFTYCWIFCYRPSNWLSRWLLTMKDWGLFLTMEDWGYLIKNSRYIGIRHKTIKHTGEFLSKEGKLGYIWHMYNVCQLNNLNNCSATLKNDFVNHKALHNPHPDMPASTVTSCGQCVCLPSRWGCAMPTPAVSIHTSLHCFISFTSREYHIMHHNSL